MNWIVDNIPIISGVAVAFLSFLSSLIKFLNEPNVGVRGMKKMKDYTEMYAALPDRVDAKKDIAKLLKQETERTLRLTNRKVNKSNVAAVIFLSVLGGGLSYLFALWATNSSITIITILAWLLFATAVVFTFGISIAGLADLYEQPENKKSDDNKAER